jgi:hypothetical protein
VQQCLSRIHVVASSYYKDHDIMLVWQFIPLPDDLVSGELQTSALEPKTHFASCGRDNLSSPPSAHLSPDLLSQGRHGNAEPLETVPSGTAPTKPGLRMQLL